jgi:hypothetical protein
MWNGDKIFQYNIVGIANWRFLEYALNVEILFVHLAMQYCIGVKKHMFILLYCKVCDYQYRFRRPIHLWYRSHKKSHGSGYENQQE